MRSTLTYILPLGSTRNTHFCDWENNLKSANPIYHYFNQCSHAIWFFCRAFHFPIRGINFMSWIDFWKHHSPAFYLSAPICNRLYTIADHHSAWKINYQNRMMNWFQNLLQKAADVWSNFIQYGRQLLAAWTQDQ